MTRSTLLGEHLIYCYECGRERLGKQAMDGCLCGAPWGEYTDTAPSTRPCGRCGDRPAWEAREGARCSGCVGLDAN